MRLPGKIAHCNADANRRLRSTGFIVAAAGKKSEARSPRVEIRDSSFGFRASDFGFGMKPPDVVCYGILKSRFLARGFGLACSHVQA